MSIRRINTSYIHSLDNNVAYGKLKTKYNNVSVGLGNAQFFLTNGIWTRPSNVDFIDIALIGGGGGGSPSQGGGGGGVVTYIKKYFVGNATTWYYRIGFGGDAGGQSTGDGLSDTNSHGEAGGPTMFGSNVGISTFTFGPAAARDGNLNPINDSTVIISPGGGGGGPSGNPGFFAGTGGGAGAGASGSWGRLNGGEYWTTGHGFNGGSTGGASAGGGGGSCVSAGGNASGSTGGNGGTGVTLAAPLPQTFINSDSQTVSALVFGGGGGGGGSVGGIGGIGGGGNANDNGINNTGGGGGAGKKGGTGLIILWEHRQ